MCALLAAPSGAERRRTPISSDDKKRMMRNYNWRRNSERKGMRISASRVVAPSAASLYATPPATPIAASLLATPVSTVAALRFIDSRRRRGAYRSGSERSCIERSNRSSRRRERREGLHACQRRGCLGGGEDRIRRSSRRRRRRRMLKRRRRRRRMAIANRGHALHELVLVLGAPSAPALGLRVATSASRGYPSAVPSGLAGPSARRHVVVVVDIQRM